MDVGRDILSKWGLPPILCEAVGAHHEPERLPDGSDERTVAELLALASSCAGVYQGGELRESLERLSEIGLRYFDLDQKACAELLEEIELGLPAAVEVLELDTGNASFLTDIRQQATELLLRESLALSKQVETVTQIAHELEEEKSELVHRAQTDPLTGLGNRGFFDEALTGELERAQQAGHSLGLLLLDLDHFKRINDTYGHQLGDEVLRKVSDAVKGTLHREDSASRYGGEELAVIIPDVSLDGLGIRAEQIRTAVAEVDIRNDGEVVHVTASIGGCWVARVDDPEIAEKVISTADEELYKAKASGRNKVHVAKG